MSSIIHYKFRSAKEFDSYHFEGAGIPVWQLKVEIIENKKLEKSTDFDLVITNAQTSADYTDDSQIIPRNTSVVVRRVPVAPGTAKVYPARQPKPLAKAATSTTINTTSQGPLSTGDSDVQKMIFQSSARFDQQALANAAVVQHQHPHGRKQMTFRPKPTSTLPQQPPANYVCFRCGEKGHYIQQCPTNLDPNYDKPRIKKTTGIPKSFLKPVEGNVIDARAADPTVSLMVTAEGQTVVNHPNENEWKRLIETRTLSSELVEGEEAGLEEAETSDGSRCPNNHLLVNTVLLSCCGTKYCENCAQNLQVCGKCNRPQIQLPTGQTNKPKVFKENDLANIPNEANREEDSKRSVEPNLPSGQPSVKGSPKDAPRRPYEGDSVDSYEPRGSFAQRDSRSRDRKYHDRDSRDRSHYHSDRPRGGSRYPEDQHHYSRSERSRSPPRSSRRRRSRSRSPRRDGNDHHYYSRSGRR
jgi:protein MPE1